MVESLGGGDAGLDPQRALLIVASVIGKGTRLLAISRDLRDAHIGARTYLVGVQIAETEKQILQLASNLTFSSKGATIVLTPFRVLSIGSALS